MIEADFLTLVPGQERGDQGDGDSQVEADSLTVVPGQERCDQGDGDSQVILTFVF